MRVNWTVINFWLDAALFAVFLLILWISIVVRCVFPPAAQAAGWTLWGWRYQHWIDFQFTLLWMMALGVLLHVTLHWSWVCGVVTQRLWRKRGTGKRKLDDGTRTLYGVGVLILIVNLLGFALAGAVLMIHGPTY